MAQAVNTERFADVCAALGNPVRIQILQQLREPKALGEIIVKPNRKEGDQVPDRAMSRVSVRGHLDKLLAIRAVRVQRGMRKGKAVDLYVVNHGRVFTLAEEMRRLALLRPQDVTGSETEVLGQRNELNAQGAFLVLVNGVFEGKIFNLEGRQPDGDIWHIGRSADNPVCLDYDPFVSLRNATICIENGEFCLVARPGTRNGTFHNWVEVTDETPRPLTSGDVIGVGRSLMVFRQA